MPSLDFTATHRASTLRPAAHLKEPPRHYIVFRIDRQSYALPLENVTRALRMVALTPIPDAAEGLLGVINLAGRVVPVVDLRLRLGHPCRAPELNDRLLIIEAAGQTLAVAADAVLSVLELAAGEVTAPPLALAQAQPLAATLQHGEELVLVLDPARLLPPTAGEQTTRGEKTAA